MRRTRTTALGAVAASTLSLALVAPAAQAHDHDHDERHGDRERYGHSFDRDQHDRKHDRKHDRGHDWNRDWNRDHERDWERDRDWDRRDRKHDRDRDWSRDRDGNRDRSTPPRNLDRDSRTRDARAERPQRDAQRDTQRDVQHPDSQRPDRGGPDVEALRARAIEGIDARLATLTEVREQLEASSLPAVTVGWLVERIASYEAALQDLRAAIAEADSVEDLRDLRRAPAG